MLLFFILHQDIVMCMFQKCWAWDHDQVIRKKRLMRWKILWCVLSFKALPKLCH